VLFLLLGGLVVFSCFPSFRKTPFNSTPTLLTTLPDYTSSKLKVLQCQL
jgi:hypothetical protein